MLLPPDLRDWGLEDALVDLRAVPTPHDAGAADLELHQRPVFLAQARASHPTRRGGQRPDVSGHPDHDTICNFRRENFEAFSESSVDALELARELKLIAR